MPSRRTKEDTWKEEELLDAIQGSDRKQKSSSSKASKSGESSRHRSKEEGKDRDRVKHKRLDTEGYKKESERKERDRRKEKSEDKDKVKDPDDGDKSRRRHKEEDRDRRKEDRESSSRRKEDKVRTESKDDRVRRKEREKEEKHREHRKDKESRKDRERNDDKKKEEKRGERIEKRRKHKSEDGNRNNEMENTKEKGSESKEERRKYRSSKTEADDPGEDLTRDVREKKIEDSSKLKEKGKDHKEKRSADEVGREERRRPSKDTKIDKKRSGEKDVAESLRKRESFQHPEEEIEEEMTSKRPSASIRKSSILNTEEVNEEEIDANEYDYGDDDFEDYDDDFEQDDGDDDQSAEEPHSPLTYEDIEGVNEIQKAIQEENQLAGSMNNSRSSSRPSTRDEQGGRSATLSKSEPRSKINFFAAKQKKISEKVASKTRRRGQELSKLIELDVVGMDIFELQPLNIYEVYMKSFGRMNTEQVAVQTNDDTLDQEVQTDEIKTETRWSQFSNEVQSFGGGDEKTSNTSYEEKSILRQDTRRLNKFLSRAAQLCITLLSEVESGQDRVLNRYSASHTKFSESVQKLVMTSELIHNRRIVDNDLSQSNLILLAYGKLETNQKEYVSPDGIICIWNLNATTEPQKYLSCGSTPKCCCFSPRKPSFAIAGMEDGSVSAWDLREPDSMHTRHKFGKTEAVIRRETFSTASVYSGETHSSSVVSIRAVASPADPSDSSSSTADNNANGALQIVSLEENGTINIWVVIEVFSSDPGGSPQDLGLMPGGKIKLVKSGAIFLQMPKRHISMEQIEFFSATTLHVELNHAKSLYIGTDQLKMGQVRPETFLDISNNLDTSNNLVTSNNTGLVLHSSRFGDKVNPKYFDIGENGTAKIVSSIDHSPWDLPYILVGCTDGSVYLFNSHQGYPVSRWQMFSRGAAIMKVQWSRSKPGVFFILDEQSCFYVWDLFASESGPLMMDLVKTSTSIPVDFCLTNDSSEKSQRLVIFYDDNAIEVHRLNKSFSESSTETLNQVCARLEEIS